MGHEAQKVEKLDKPAGSRHTGRRRWVTYSGYMLGCAGLACLVVHIFAGWKLAEVNAMLPTYLWIVTVVLIVLGSAMALFNEGLKRLEGTQRVVFGQVVGDPPTTGGTRPGRGKRGETGKG